MNMTARENLTLPNLRPFWKRLWLRQKLERTLAAEWFARLGVRPADGYDDPISMFSGGNQQKVLFGKWLSQAPSVSCSTARRRASMWERRRTSTVSCAPRPTDGAAVVISSSDLEELADLCNRVVVLVDGRITAELSGSDLTEASITRRFMPADVAA